MYEPKKYYDYAAVMITGKETRAVRGEQYGDIRIISVLKLYGINPVQIISHKQVYKVIGENRNYALKKVEIDPLRLIFFLSAMDYLWQRGFSRMAKPVKNLSGELYVDTGEGLFFVTEWIEGRYIDFSRIEELGCAIHLLADMHWLGEGFSPPPNCLGRNDIGQWPQKWKRRIADLEKMAMISREGKDGFDMVFNKTIGFSLEESYQALDVLESSGYQEYCTGLEKLRPLCHRDFVYHNIIYSGMEAFLIDFEYCVQDSRVTDLARFIRTNWNQHPWEVETSSRIISLYHQRYPLGEMDQRMLLVLLMFPHDIWRVGHRWYFSGQRKKSNFNLLYRQYQYHHLKNDFFKKIKQASISH